MRLISWLTTATDIGKDINDILNHGYESSEEGVEDSLGELREAVTTISKSTIHLVISASFALIAMAFLIVALKLGAANPKTRDEAKTKICYILLAAGGVMLISACYV